MLCSKSTGYGYMMGGTLTPSTLTSSLPSLLLESIVTSTKISVMPSDSPQSNTAASSLVADPSSRHRPANITSAGQSSTLRFDKRVLPNYSSSFLSSSLTSVSRKSDMLLGRQTGAFPALPVQLLNCEQCGRSYACEYTLKRHIRLECGKEATLQCPLCPRRTKHKHSLLRHINKFHPGAHIWHVICHCFSHSKHMQLLWSGVQCFLHLESPWNKFWAFQLIAGWYISIYTSEQC